MVKLATFSTPHCATHNNLIMGYQKSEKKTAAESRYFKILDSLRRAEYIIIRVTAKAFDIYYITLAK